jgi:DNA-binding transcriptional MerR regulator
MSLRAGAVARAAGVGRETLRYYERRGLLTGPERSPGGHRLYDEQTVATMRAIKAAQRLGFTLREIAHLLQNGSGRRAGLQTEARAKLAEIDQRLTELTAARATLVAAVEAGCDDLRQCARNSARPIPPDRP